MSNLDNVNLVEYTPSVKVLDVTVDSDDSLFWRDCCRDVSRRGHAVRYIGSTS